MTTQITVKCGYENCDWKIVIPTDTVYGDFVFKEENRSKSHYPLIYINHCIKVHSIPSAYWRVEEW